MKSHIVKEQNKDVHFYFLIHEWQTDKKLK